MRFNIVKNIFRKEIKDIFRDKKTIFTMIILPILLYPLIMLGSMQIGAMVGQQMAETIYKVATNEALPKDVVELMKKGENIEFVEVENYEEALENEEIDAYIDFSVADNQESYKVYYLSSENKSSMGKGEIEDYLDGYKTLLTEKRLVELGLEQEAILEPLTFIEMDIAKNEQKAGHLLAMILPFILIVSLASGAVYPAIDVMAGEKERGTIETLLTLPVSSMELIMGKYIAVSTVAMMSALLNILSIGATIGLMFASMKSMEGMADMEMPSIAIGQFALPLLITIITIFIFTLVVTALSMSICALAKSFKEAQNYMTPLMMLIMFPSYVTMIPTVELTTMTATIPVVNIALLMKSVLTFKYDIGLMAIVLFSNLAFACLAIFVLIKLFNSEEILFGSGKEFNILQRRYNIQKGTMPTASDSMLVYGIALLALLYIGQLLQLNLGFMGIALTQVMLLSIALFFAYYIKADFKQVFSIRLPRFKHVIGTVLLWLGTYILAMGLAHILLPLSSQNEEVMKQLSEALMHENLWVNLLVVAVLPALCEEALFRGVIYKGLEGKGKGKRAILLSALLFGMMHLDFIRIPITGLLGISMAYLVYKTGSLLLPMLFHLINNGLAVVIQHMGIQDIETTPIEGSVLLGIFIVGIGIVGIALMFFREQCKEKQ